MKNEMRTLFAAAALAVAGATTVQAADITALTGHVTKLNADCSALVYYGDHLHIAEPNIAVSARLLPQ